MMSLLRPLMAGVLLLAVPSSALGPPNGTVGTLDFRYPNYIVEPLVNCRSEGYFPHPRDNTWFYRCYNRYSSSFFWRAYFQCPPCTVFSDALDQCVFQETGTRCLPPAEPCRTSFEDCRRVGICPAATSNRAVVSPVEVCFKTTWQCPGQLYRPLCRDGYVFDKTNGWCRVGTQNSPCLPKASPTPTPISPYVPTPPTITIPKPTPIPAIPKPIPNVCKLAGSRPSADDYQTLGCSERQFCDPSGLLKVSITNCQWYQECNFTAPGVFQVVLKQCPAGQLFLYGNVNQCGQLVWYDCPVSREAPLYSTTSDPPPTPSPVTTFTSTTTTTERLPFDVNYYIDNFVCKLAGSRPSAEGYRTLGCSERQFCDPSGLLKAPITSCQWYLECDFTSPGRLQLVPKQCPSGQLFFYGNVNQCGGQIGLFECPPQLTPTITTPTAPALSPENCTYFGEILGMVGEVKDNCYPSCGDSGQTQDSYPYCGNFLQCTLKKNKFILEPASCPSEYTFDTTTSRCRKITRNGSKGPVGCIALDSSTNSSEPGCIYLGQLMNNLNKAEDEKLRCHKHQCSDGRSSVTLCERFYLCLADPYGGEMFPQATTCHDSANKFNLNTRKCVTPQTYVC